MEDIKHAISQRFIEAINLLVSRKLFHSPRDYGLKNSIKASTLSDFKSGRSNVDLKHIYTLIKQFPFLSLDYIILGEGKIEREIFIKPDESGLFVTTSEKISLEELDRRLTEIEILVKKYISQLEK